MWLIGGWGVDQISTESKYTLNTLYTYKYLQYIQTINIK